MKIGTNKRFTRMAHRDPNPGIPFVDPYPPAPGVTYWLVCAVVVGFFGASVYLGVWG